MSFNLIWPSRTLSADKAGTEIQLLRKLKDLSTSDETGELSSLETMLSSRKI